MLVEYITSNVCKLIGIQTHDWNSYLSKVYSQRRLSSEIWILLFRSTIKWNLSFAGVSFNL